jgi:hypothetical protein
VNCARWCRLRHHLARDLEVIAQGILQVEEAFIT